MHVIATAGHVDHGKSTLVRALTGMEPDRWAEERRRGMTIDLGYAWTLLPSGEPVSFVDVPGHQRFIDNMLAGVGPAPAVLIVVAADEGWRRQCEEHLAAVDALGVRHGLLAVTRSDLADPGPALEEALDRLAASSLGRVDSVVVSGATRAGLPDLAAALDRLVAALPAPDVAAPVRLWVDRAFTIAGAGTVVTGTLGAGRIALGDELVLAPAGRTVRVRGLQTLGSPVEEVAAVARVAVNLRGVDRAEVRRGHALLSQGGALPTEVADVRLTADPRELPGHLVFHVGSAGRAARLRPVDGRTARLTLAAALPLRRGDRGLLRDPGAHRVAAGVEVLDIDPPELRGRGAAAARARELAAGLDPVGEIARRAVATRRQLAAADVLAAEATPPPGVRVVGDLVVADERWVAWRTALVAAVDAHAVTHVQPGLPLEAARRMVRVPDARLLPALAADAGLETVGGRIRRAGVRPEFPPPVRAALDELRERLRADPFAAPEAAELATAGLTPPVVAAAANAGLLLRLAAGVVLLPSAEAEAIRRLATLPRPFTAGQARVALRTTRRVAVPLLEHLDGRRRTRKLPGMLREVIR